MNIFSTLSLFAAGIYLYIGIFVLQANYRSTLNRLFLLLCLTFSIWSSAYSFFIIAPDKHAAWLLYRISSIGWLTAPAALLLFCLKLSDNGRFLKKRWIGLIFLPSAILFIRHLTGNLLAGDFDMAKFGWIEMLKVTVWSETYDISYVIICGIAFVSVFRWGYASNHPIKKRQAKLIVISGIVTVMLASITNRIMPLFAFYRLPGMAQFILLIFIFAIWYAIAKFKLMTLSMTTAAGEIVTAMVEGLILLDGDSRIHSVNQAAVQILGRAEKDLISRPITEIIPKCPFLDKTQIRPLLRNGPVRNFEFLQPTSPGKNATISLSVSQVRDQFGQPIGAVLIVRDISGVKQAEEELRFMATHDPLTKIPNRLLFNDRVNQALSRARRYGHTVAIGLIDMDHFKEINDTFGHDIGDGVLQGAAQAINKCIRESDTVARLGGDEFALALTDLKDSAEAIIVADRLMKSLSKPITVGQHQIHTTFSIGIGTYPAAGNNLEELMKNADQALYYAKTQGRNNYQLYAPVLGKSEGGRTPFEEDLHQAVKQNSFELHYQPVFDLKTRRLSGIEALLRWRHPKIGLIPPMDFIPQAERMGLMTAIGEWVIRTACRQMKIWQENGLTGIPVAVNVSVQQFDPSKLIALIKNSLDETGLRSDLLALEITESTVIRDINRSLDIINSLRILGVCIIIDDFGAGHSSLSWLKDLQVNAIKIDNFFIQNIADDYHYAAIVKAIIAFAHGLNVQVIAEGVETQAQLDFLASEIPNDSFTHRCDQVQGYVFSKPVTADEFKKLYIDLKPGK
jgi:diguanylate cyclase (GGDEF)-like protein/PAS domain S-box-containing protein